MDRIYTGFKSVDKNLKISKGDLVVVGGMPAMGKTCLTCAIIEKTISNQKSLFFSMQTQKHKAVERLKQYVLEENKKFSLIENVVDFYEFLMIVAEIKLQQELDVVFIDNFSDFVRCSDFSASEMVEKIKQIAKRLGIAIVVTDVILEVNDIPMYRNILHKQFIKHANKIIIVNKIDKLTDSEDMAFELEKNGVFEIIIHMYI